MSAIYELIGRIVVGFVRTRYRQQIRAAAVVGVGVAVVAAIGAYAATKDSDERG